MNRRKQYEDAMARGDFATMGAIARVANALPNMRRRVNRARNFPGNTCPASRHLHIMAETLAAGRTYHMLTEDQQHCAGSMLSVLESLWKARTQLAKLEAKKP